VVSLYQRLVRLQIPQPLDLAFLWVGVNDLPTKDTWLSRAANTLAGQRRSRDLDEFREYYEATLEHLCRIGKRVIAVSPALRGEDINNRWNHQLQTVATLIKESAPQHERAEYLDLWPALATELAKRNTIDYVPSSAVRVALDTLTLRDGEQVDRKAAQRGLHLTLDGLHLNSAGAEIVASAFAEVISNAASQSPEAT
jgi:lysophospholipase L1-like esterase